MAEGDTTDRDVALSTGTWKVRVGAALSALTGLMLAVTGIQILVAVRYFYVEILNLVPWLFLLLGALHVLVAAMLYRARRWAAVASTALSGGTLLASFLWLGYSAMNTMFSCPATLAPVLALAATVLGALAIPDAHAATEARKRLAASGIELGL